MYACMYIICATDVLLLVLFNANTIVLWLRQILVRQLLLLLLFEEVLQRSSRLHTEASNDAKRRADALQRRSIVIRQRQVAGYIRQRFTYTHRRANKQ